MSNDRRWTMSDDRRQTASSCRSQGIVRNTHPIPQMRSKSLLHVGEEHRRILHSRVHRCLYSTETKRLMEPLQYRTGSMSLTHWRLCTSGHLKRNWWHWWVSWREQLCLFIALHWLRRSDRTLSWRENWLVNFNLSEYEQHRATNFGDVHRHLVSRWESTTDPWESCSDELFLSGQAPKILMEKKYYEAHSWAAYDLNCSDVWPSEIRNFLSRRYSLIPNTWRLLILKKAKMLPRVEAFMEIHKGVTNSIHTLQRNFQLIKDSARLTNPKPVTIAGSRGILPENIDKSLPTPTNLSELLNLGSVERSMVTKQIAL